MCSSFWSGAVFIWWWIHEILHIIVTDTTGPWSRMKEGGYGWWRLWCFLLGHVFKMKQNEILDIDLLPSTAKAFLILSQSRWSYFALSRIMSWTASSWIMLKIIVVLTHPDGNQFVFWCNIGWILEANSVAGCCWRWDWFTWKQQRESRWAPLQDKCFDLYWVTLHQLTSLSSDTAITFTVVSNQFRSHSL